MWSRPRVHSVLVVFGLLLLWGCGKSGPQFVSRYEPWREAEEAQCLRSGHVRATPFIVQRAAVSAAGYCGASQPFEMTAALGGRVTMRPAALLRCPMIPAVEYWVQTTVMQAALRNFGQPVVEIKVASSYSCRPMNHVDGARLSEHGHANALDVSAFQLADGRWISVKQGWYGDLRERNFLRHVHQGGCETFATVLGPNYDAAHRDHFHFDLARRGRDGEGRICK